MAVKVSMKEEIQQLQRDQFQTVATKDGEIQKLQEELEKFKAINQLTHKQPHLVLILAQQSPAVVHLNLKRVILVGVRIPQKTMQIDHPNSKGIIKNGVVCGALDGIRHYCTNGGTMVILPGRRWSGIPYKEITTGKKLLFIRYLYRDKHPLWA